MKLPNIGEIFMKFKSIITFLFNGIMNEGTGYSPSIPQLHLYDESTEKGRSLPHFAFKHFHNFNSMGERDKNYPQHRSHSFFGLLYYAQNNDGIGTIHPESPKY